MKIVKYFKVIFISFFFILTFTSSKAELKIAVVEMDRVMKESLVGKSVLQQLDKLDKDNKKFFNEKRKKLSLKKDKINSQKEILSKEEYEKKIIELNKEFENEKKKANTRVKDLRTKRNKAMAKLLSELNVVLSEYSDKNKLTFIIDQKNIIMVRTDLNVTNEILKLLDAKITKIKLN